MTAAAEEILRGLFHGAGGPPPALGKDVRQPLPLSTLQVSEGTRVEVPLRLTVACTHCGGARGEGWTVCGSCNGRTAGLFSSGPVCDRCTGRGGAFTEPCLACAGLGGETREEKITVVVPPGTAPDATLRMRGKGNVLDGTPGDAYLNIVLVPGEGLTLHGHDLHVRHSIDATLAASGGTTQVPWLEGHVPARVPEGTKTGDVLTVRGAGATRPGAAVVPPPRGPDAPYRALDASEHRGDLVVTLVIEGEAVPDALLTPLERMQREEADEDASSNRLFAVASGVVATVLAAAWWLFSG